MVRGRRGRRQVRPAPGPADHDPLFLLREPREMVRTHLPGACPGVRTECPSRPRRERRRAAGWAWVVSLLVAGPAAAGDGRAPAGLLERLGFRKPAPAAPAARPAAAPAGSGAVPGGEEEEDVEDRTNG